MRHLYSIAVCAVLLSVAFQALRLLPKRRSPGQQTARQAQEGHLDVDDATALSTTEAQSSPTATPPHRAAAPVQVNTASTASISLAASEMGVRAHGERASPQEREGRLRHLYAEWSSAQLDATTSRRAKRFFDEQFQLNDVAPLAQHIACTSRLCRARLVFPDMAALRQLARVDRSQLQDLAVGNPYRPEGEDINFVIYVTADPEGLTVSAR